jgi:hypothetical protein
VTHHAVVRVRLSCPATSVGNCAGTDTLTAFRRVLARRSFSIPPGQLRTLAMKLSRRGRALLRRHRSMRARETVVAHDGSGAANRTVAAVTLKLARR